MALATAVEERRFSAALSVKTEGLQPRQAHRIALNFMHCSASGGVVFPSPFGSARITFFSDEQNRRRPVRSNTSGAAPTT